jgi:carbonic anhydrase
VPRFSNLPTEVGVEQTINVTVNLAGFLPEVRTTHRYDASLTTPPCSEAVHLLVFTEPVELSADQAAAATFKTSARPVQPLNGRTVEEDSTA